MEKILFHVMYACLLNRHKVEIEGSIYVELETRSFNKVAIKYERRGAKTNLRAIRQK